MTCASSVFGARVLPSYNPVTLWHWMWVMTVSPVLQDYANRTELAVRRWNTTLSVPKDADDARAASLIRGALMRAAQNAAKFDLSHVYNDDNSWSHNGVRGLSRSRIVEEVRLSRDKMAPASEEWGIMARVEFEDGFFDVPVAVDLDEAAARNIVSRLDGLAARFVNVDMISASLPGENFGVRLHADNWAHLRELALEGFLTMDEAMDFRRPVVWDLTRARMADLPPEPLTPFSEEEFYTRFAKSSRFDTTLMRSNRDLIESISRINVEPFTPGWGEWHPAVIDVLNSIGQPQQMDGISIILNFVVEEPLSNPPLDDEGFAEDAWGPVGYHNMIVCYGLHPLSAIHILDLVKRNATAFYEIPPQDEKRHVLIGVSAIQDTMLSAMRVSVHGRTDAYDRIAEVPLVG
jgi:hypothetical protein